MRARISQGDVAQLVEHLVCNQGVGGSSPLVSTEGKPRFAIEPSPGVHATHRILALSDRS
jgi:hypothetical protein